MKKIFILVTCILMSFNMNAYANEDKDTVSIKGVVEGTKKAVGKVGDKISETTKNIYEAEIPKDKLIDAAGGIIGGIGGIIGYILLFLLNFFSFFIILRAYAFIHILIKYFFFNKNNSSKEVLEDNFVQSRFYIIFSTLYFLFAIGFYVHWVYFNKFPLSFLFN